MITKEDAIAFVKQLEELKAEQQLKEDRGPLDLTRRIDELEDNVIQIHEFNIKLAKVVLPNEELPDTPSSLDDE